MQGQLAECRALREDNQRLVEEARALLAEAQATERHCAAHVARSTQKPRVVYRCTEKAASAAAPKKEQSPAAGVPNTGEVKTETNIPEWSPSDAPLKK